MDSMKARLITAAVGVPLAVVVLILGERYHWIMYTLIAVLSLLMVFELLAARKIHTKLPIFIPCALYAFCQPLLFAIEVNMLPTYVFMLVAFLSMIVFNSRISFNDVAFSALGTLIIVWGMSSILMLSPAYNNYFSFFFVVCVGIPWCADAGAYFSGVFLGAHKLCPKISPNKTVEGFLGGIVVGTVCSVIIGFVYSFLYPNAEFNYGILLLIGIFASAISVLGDLSFSLIKRSCKIKDFGSIFPGHGGFLDRFDSVIIAAPLVYFIGSYFSLFLL